MMNVSQITALANTLASLKSYETIDPQTGAVVNSIKYLVGNPRQYRFNGQNGRININGIKDLGSSFEFTPMAWRVFNASLFGRKGFDLWAELFFIDNSSCVCSLMFSNTSAQIFQNLLGQILYENLSLDNISIKVSSERRTNEKVNGIYYIAQFSFEVLSEDSCSMHKDYCKDFFIYRNDTITQAEEILICSDFYRSPSAIKWHDTPDSAVSVVA